MDCGTQVFFDKRTGDFYIKSDDGNTCIPLQFPTTTVVGGGRSGLSRSQVINLINQFGDSGKYDLVIVITGIPDGCSMTATISGGTPPYTFLQWENAHNSSSQSATTPFLATTAVMDTSPTGSTTLFRAKAMDADGNIVIAYFLNTTTGTCGPPP